MNTPALKPEYTPPLLDIPQIWGILWYRKWLILLVTAVFVALAAGYLAITRPVYKAQGIILIDPREVQASGSRNVIGGLGSDSAAIASQVAIISSIDALRAVFKAEKLENDPEFNRPGLLSKWLGRSPSVKDPALKARLAFESFMKRLDVQREGLTYILNVTYTSEDKKKAARIVNAVINRYISGQVQEKLITNQEVTQKLNDRINSLRKAVSDAEKAVVDFKRKHDIFDLGTGRTLLKTRIDQTNAQLMAAKAAERAADIRYRQARQLSRSQAGIARLTEFLSSQSTAQLRDKFNDRKLALAQAKIRLKSGHPTLKRIRSEVRFFEKLMRQEALRVVKELRANKQLAANNVRTISRELRRLRKQADRSNRLSVQLRQLERNSEASRGVLEKFLARAKVTGQLGEFQRPDARIVSKAVPPVRAAWPRKKLILLIAGLLGLLTGVMLAFIFGNSSAPAPDFKKLWPGEGGGSKPRTPPEKGQKGQVIQAVPLRPSQKYEV